MEQSKSQGREVTMLQPWEADHFDQSQLTNYPGFMDVLAIKHPAGASESQDASDGAQTPNRIDANHHTTAIAHATVSHKTEDQVSDFESIKALLRNYLDNIRGPQKERSSYLDGLLSQWLNLWRSDRNHALLVYILNDGNGQYKNRRLDFNALETIDKSKTNILEQQCSKQGAWLHLAKMTSAVNADPEDTLGLKVAVCLHEIRDLDGELAVDKPVAVGKESIIQKSLLAERYHRSIDRPTSCSTNGSPSLHIDSAKTFQDWVLVIMPEAHRFRFLTENADPPALHDWIKTISAEIEPSKMDLAKTDPNKLWGLKLACKTQLNNIKTWLANPASHGFPQEADRMSDMLEATVSTSLILRDPDLFEKAVRLNPRMLSLARWEKVGSIVELAQFFLYQTSLTQALKKVDSFQDRYMILFSIREACEARNEPQESMDYVRGWVENQIRQALDEIERVEENDGAVLILVAKEYLNDITTRSIISFAKKHSSNQYFSLEFAFSLFDELARNTMDAGFARYALAEILTAAVPGLCAPGAPDWSLALGNPTSPIANAPAQDQQRMRADRMARIVRCCLIAGLRNEEHAILRHMWLRAGAADAPTLQHIFLPYLKSLLAVMQDHHIPLTAQSYQWQFQGVISLFIMHYIGKEPVPLWEDFTCPPLGCASPQNPYGCPTCLELDAFLVDPRRQTADVTGGIDAPEHVSAQIQGTDYLQMTILSHSAAQMLSTIRITKNKIKAEEPDARHELWKERVVKANDSIQAVCGDEEWKLLLGETYDECMGLKAVRVE